MYADPFWLWLFIFVGLGLFACIVWSAALDQQQPSKPPNSPVVHKTQAQRGGTPRRPLYGTPDITKQEEEGNAY